MDLDWFGAKKNCNYKTHKMNKQIWEGETDIQNIALYAYRDNKKESIRKVKRHIRWLCGKEEHASGSVRVRMKNAGIDDKTIEERIQRVRRQFPDVCH